MRPSERHARIWRYGLAAVGSLAVVAVTLLLHDFLSPTLYFLVWPFVMLCGWLGGPGPGLLAAAISLLLLNFFIAPPAGESVIGPSFVTRAVIMMTSTLLAGLASNAQMRLARALEASRQQTLEILEGVSDPFYGLDQDWRFTYVNRAAEQLWGRPRDALIGKNIWDEFPQGAQTEAYQVMHRAMGEQRPQQFETFSDFLGRWLEVNIYPAAHGLSVYFRDIDKRKRVEDELHRSQRFIEQVANATPDVIYTYDLVEQRIVYANRELFTILGYTPEQIQAMGKDIIPTLLHPDDLELLEQQLRRLSTAVDGEMIECEYRIRHANGNWRWLDSHEVVFTRTVDGRPRQIVGAAQDVTTRKQAERRAAILQQITAHFSEAVTPQHIAQIIVQEGATALGGCAGRIGVLEEGNKSLATLSEYNIKQGPLQRFGRVPLDQPVPLADVIRTGQPIWIHSTDEYLSLYPHLRDVLAASGSGANASLPLIVNGRVIGVFSLDFSQPKSFAAEDRELLLELAQQCAQALERARLYEVETRARQRAEEDDRLKMQFLGMISHELRTPLTSIKGFATTLLAKDVRFTGEEQRQFLGIIDDEADKLTDLVDQLLDLSRLQAGKLRIQPDRLSLSTIFEGAAAQLKALTVRHRLMVCADERLPPVLADRQRVGQVLVNLVNNAAKFSPTGSPITLTASAHGDEVRIDVSDQGVGIPAEARSLVFEAFRQVERKDMGLPGQSRGAGLGLAICKGIIEAHGKRIWVTENVPQGTIISFTLPTAN
jgi:PAS domain S-box-containing protein